MRILLPMSLVALSACAPRSGGDVQALSDQVTELQAQVAELQAFQKKVEMVVELPADPEREVAALEMAYAARDALAEGDTETAKKLLNTIVDDYGDTQIAAPAMDMLRELKIIGSDAGALDVERWVQGEHTLDADKLTVLVFFEQWCPHCQREMPNLQKTWAKLNDQGLDMVGLTSFSRGTSEQAMTDFLAESEVAFPIGKDDGSLSRRFAANGVPHAAVVKGGEILWIGHPAELEEARLLGWLGE